VLTAEVGVKPPKLYKNTEGRYNRFLPNNVSGGIVKNFRQKEKSKISQTQERLGEAQSN
jgi:hypothetical protein